MKRKAACFGSTKVEKKDNGHERLIVDDYFGDCEISVHDAEIKDNEDNPELVGISITDIDDKVQEFFFHKKDCLQLSTFLLNIHTEYSNRVNELELKDYSKKLSKED